MSAVEGTMIRGNMLTSANGSPANKVAFTKRNDGVDAPRNFKEEINNVGMLHDGIIREDVMDTVPGNKPLNFQNRFSYIFPDK